MSDGFLDYWERAMCLTSRKDCWARGFTLVLDGCTDPLIPVYAIGSSTISLQAIPFSSAL